MDFSKLPMGPKDAPLFLDGRGITYDPDEIDHRYYMFDHRGLDVSALLSVTDHDEDC